MRQLLHNNKERINYNQSFDFCCGGGEVSMALKDLGYTNTIASDPFTQAAYAKNINKNCLDYTFMDIIKGKLTGVYTSIICSFAMHLCPEKQLYSLVWQLFNHTNSLIIITPHKRPILEDLEGVNLVFEDFVLTKERGKKVRLKCYSNKLVNFSQECSSTK